MSNYSLFGYLIEPIITRIYSFISNIKYSEKDEENYFEKLNSSLKVKRAKTLNNNIKKYKITENISNNLFRNYTNNSEKNYYNFYITNLNSKNNDNKKSRATKEKSTQNLLGKKTNRLNIKTELEPNNDFINDFNSVNENNYYIIKEKTPDKMLNIINESENSSKNNQNSDNEIEDFEINNSVDNENSLKNNEFININKKAEEEIKNNKNEFIELNENQIKTNNSLYLKNNSINDSLKKSRIFNGNLSVSLNDSFSCIIKGVKKINTKNNFVFEKGNDFSYIVQSGNKSKEEIDKKIIKEKIENEKDYFVPVNDDETTKIEWKNNKDSNNKELKQNFESNNNIFINNSCQKEEIKSNLFNSIKNKNNNLFGKSEEIKAEDIKYNENNKLLSKEGLFENKNNEKNLLFESKEENGNFKAQTIHNTLFGNFKNDGNKSLF